MKKVLIIYNTSYDYYYNIPDGAFISITEICNYLRNYYEVYDFIYYNTNELKKNNINFLIQLYCRIKPDCIISFHNSTKKINEFIHCIKFFKNTPLIFCYRRDIECSSRISRECYNILHNHFKKVQVLLPEYVQYYNDVFIPNAFNIENNIDFKLFDNKILYCGRISKETKETHLLTNIVDNNYEYTFLGTDLDNLLKGKKCNFLGFVKNPQDYYQTNSVLIVTSRYEGFCRSCVEAMSYGLPVIGFEDCTAMRHHIKHGWNGLLVKERSEKALKETIELFFREYNTIEIKQNAYEYAKQYNKDKILPMWKDLIDSVMYEVKH